MNALLLLAPSDGGGQVEQIAPAFGVDWPHLGAQIISFAIVCAVLYRFAYGPVLKMLEERRQQIAQGMANAAQIKAELAKTEAARQEVIGAANAEAARLIEEARTAAARVLQEETRRATAAAEESVSRAREATGQDHPRMLAQLKRGVDARVRRR